MGYSWACDAGVQTAVLINTAGSTAVHATHRSLTAPRRARWERCNAVGFTCDNGTSSSSRTRSSSRPTLHGETETKDRAAKRARAYPLAPADGSSLGISIVQPPGEYFRSSANTATLTGGLQHGVSSLITVALSSTGLRCAMGHGTDRQTDGSKHRLMLPPTIGGT